MDIAPRYSGFLHGIADAIYSSGGFVVPIMCNALIGQNIYSLSDWSHVWYFCASISSLGTLGFIIFVNCDKADWAIEAEARSTTEGMEPTTTNKVIND